MRKRLSLIVLVIAGIGLLSATTIRAQQPATSSSAPVDSNEKPCIVVYGAVRSPARFELRREVRLAEVLAIAGGLTERIGGTILVIHSGMQCFHAEPRRQSGGFVQTPGEVSAYEVSEVLRAEEKANPYLRGGDVVIANEMGPIYVTGNVKSPQAVFRKEPMTLTEAIRLAGGVLSASDVRSVHIYRMKGDRFAGEDLKYDLALIKKHRSADPVLKPYDIIDVIRKHGGDVFGGRGPIVGMAPARLPSRVIE